MIQYLTKVHFYPIISSFPLEVELVVVTVVVSVVIPPPPSEPPMELEVFLTVFLIFLTFVDGATSDIFSKFLKTSNDIKSVNKPQYLVLMP